MFGRKLPLVLQSLSVPQGNGNGISIDYDKTSNVLLKTGVDPDPPLVGCMAVLIVTSKKCYMLHSDAIDNSGVGKISLVEGLKSFGIEREEKCEVGLIGGRGEAQFKLTKDLIKQVLPIAEITMTKESEQAYLLGDGFRATSKQGIKAHLNVSEFQEKKCESIKPSIGPR